MKNFYRLIEGDCLRVLPSLESDSATMVFADPPYNLIGLDAFVDLQIYRKWFRKWMIEAFRVLAWNGTFILCGRPPVLAYLLTDVCRQGYVFREWITWHKVDSITAAKTYHSRNYEIFVIFSKWMERKFRFVPVDAKTNRYSKERNIGSVWEHPKISKNHKEGTDHPNQKPLKFLNRFIKTYTQENDTVVDLFSGSGTTTESAINLKRNCIAIELNPKWCKLIKERCFGKNFLDHEVDYRYEKFTSEGLRALTTNK